ncbi:hypothetical protein BSKO_03580 [Bryopsis sp. KO-2023]|nr:hypothetical protein BSKO_03580 [Bryopsis sp. KO-2023]
MGVQGYDDEVDEEEEEEYEDVAPSSHRKRKATSMIDDVADEDEEEEEEEDESERRGGRGGGGGVLQFLDEVAGVDEDGDEDDYEDELEGDDLIMDAPEDLPLEETHHSQRIYRQMQDQDDADEDPEELERYITERYEAQQYDQGEATATTQQSLLPTLRDPKLWVVQCRPGYERLLCIQLLNKFHAQSRGTGLMIKSAFCLDHLKGYFYVEAEKESYVREAVKGLINVFMGKGVKLVPLPEMVDAITVNKNAKLALEKGSWVRVRSGPYAGDLAKVLDVDLANQKVTVKVIPRIDFSEMANREEGRGRRGLPFGQGQKVRPAAKPFNREQAQSLGLPMYRKRVDRMVYVVVDKYQFLRGYLVKVLAMRSIVAQETMPPVEELQRFDAAGQINGEDGDEDAGLGNVLDTLPEGKHGLKKGDEVVVTKGELKRLTGKVTELKEDNKVWVKLKHEKLKTALLFDAGELTKFFQVGDHVRVDGGVHEGDMGMVIKVDNLICRVMSEATKKELRVYARDLCKTEQSHVGMDTIGDYELHDLVELDNNNFGVIVFVDKDFCKVLMASGTPDKPETRTTRLVDMRRKIQTRRSTTNDCFMNRVGTGDVVDIINGPMKGHPNSTGTVEYIIKGYLFIKCPGLSHKNHGFLAVSARSCFVRGGKNNHRQGESNFGARTPMGNATPSHSKTPSFTGLQSPRRDNMDRNQMGGLVSPRRSFTNNGRDGGGGGGFFGGGGGGRGFGGRGGGFGGGRGRGRGPSVVGKTVRVIKGPNRGYVGRITGETDTHVRLELQANCSVVTIPKGNIDLGDNGEPRRRTRARADPPSTPWQAPKTPMHTPSHSWGSSTPTPMTPIHPSMTPLHTTSRLTSRTPQRPTPNRTPIHQSLMNASPLLTHNNDSDDDDDGMSFGPPTTAPFTPARTPAMPSPPKLDVPANSGAEADPVERKEPESPPPADTSDAAATNSILPDSQATSQNEVDEVETKPAGAGDNLSELWGGLVVTQPSGEKGLVTLVGAGMCEVIVLADDGSGVLTKTKQTNSFPIKQLTPVKPQKHDPIRVLDGEFKASTGSMIGIDGTDGIVKLDGTCDIKIMEITWLGKVHSD